MHLTNEVVLPAEPERVFTLINDVERVAPCMPGATLEGKSGADAYQGRVKVKVGPISAAYSGTIRFMDVDRGGHRLVLDAKGTDQHGSGNAEAKVEVSVRPHEQGSVLTLDTDLVIRGKVAQFGGGALGDVSQKLMEQFARNLSGLLTEPAAQDTVERTPQHPASAPQDSDAAVSAAPEAELDGLSLVAVPLAKRAAPVVAGIVAGWVAGRLLGHRPTRSGRVLADETVMATVHIGSRVYSVPARQVTTLVGFR